MESSGRGGNVRNGDKGPLSWSAEREGGGSGSLFSLEIHSNVLGFALMLPASWDWQKLTKNLSSSKSLHNGVGIPIDCKGLCSGTMEFQLLGR